MIFLYKYPFGWASRVAPGGQLVPFHRLGLWLNPRGKSGLLVCHHISKLSKVGTVLSGTVWSLYILEPWLSGDISGFLNIIWYIYIVETFYAFYKIVWVYTNYIISLIFESLRHGSLAVWRHFRIDWTGPGGAWAQHGTATALRAEHRGGKGIFHGTYSEKRDKSRT